MVDRLGREYLAGDYVEEWDLAGLFTQLEQMYPVAMAPEDVDSQSVEREELIRELQEDIVKAYEEREEELGEELMRALERYMLLQIIDERWREHLHDMDYLREGIHLRGFAQIDPLVAYKNEGFEMFTRLMNAIWEEYARYIFRVEVDVEPQNGTGQASESWQSSPSSTSTGLRYAGGTAADQPSALRAAAEGEQAGVPAGIAAAAGHAAEATAGAPALVETRRVEETTGRNDPCPCGSGKKYKKCHGA